MAVLGTFIGIDKYQDPNVRELSGAERDAMALHALVLDSIPEVRAKLLVNADATAAAIRQSLDTTLGAAGVEDVVIVSFAGHGSKSHRLLAHDTTKADFTKTTISMADLADGFRESEARFILCLLDCCFSGGATARVFEDSPISRDADISLEALVQGKGRILFAAANTNESAYEHPPSRHGLFTMALLDVLQNTNGASDLPTMMDRVMDRVRAEAARMGVSQTPVYFGQVEGGMSLPPLRPGPLFRAAFPEVHGVRVGADIRDLSTFGLPQAVVEAWADRYPGGLNDLQRDAVNERRVLDGASLLVVAPTSAGKTFVGEMAAVRAVTDGRKAVFLLPYRALVGEKFDQFDALYGDRLGMRVIRCTGDYNDQVNDFVRARYDLALLTYEMFLNLAVSTPATLTQIGLVVLDEAQFITDPLRGISVELLLTLLIAAREREIRPQIVALSAVIGDINYFDEWLGCERLVTDQRPVKLLEGVIDRTGVFQYRDQDGAVRESQMVPPYSVQVRRYKTSAKGVQTPQPSAQDLVVPLVHRLVADGEKVIVFRNQRGKAEGCARYLANDLGLPPATDVAALLPTVDLSSTSADLRACLAGGTAFHNTNLNRDERRVVEQAFRDPNSGVRVLGATTTVAAGINTPASTVVIAEQEFISDDGRPFTVAEYKNMAGRAGRLGFAGKDGASETGKSMIYAETPLQRQELFARYVQGQVEPILSSFALDQIETWVLRLLAQVPRLEREDFVALLASTYGGYLANSRNPDWRGGMRQRLEQVVLQMLALDLIEQDGDTVQLTLLGHACGRSSLSFRAVIRLVELLKSVPPTSLTPERLMALIQALPDADNVYTPLMKRGNADKGHPPSAAARFGGDIVQLFQRRIQDEWDYHARCKRVCVLGAWIDGVSVEAIEQRYSANLYSGTIGHGDIRRFADAARFHLRPACQIVNVMYIENGISEDAIDAMLRQLEVGIPANALGLTALPVELSRGEYMALYRRSVTSPEQFWGMEEAIMVETLGRDQAKRLRALRPEPGD